MLLLVQTARVNALWSRARAALVVAQRRPEMLREAERDAARLAKEGVAYAEGIAALVRGAIAKQRGDDAEALQRFAEAERRFEDNGIAAQVASLQWVRGKLIGGDTGAQLVAKADAYFAGEGIGKSEPFARFFVPGAVD